MPYRVAGPAAFLVGVAAAYHGGVIFREIAGLTGRDGLLLSALVVIALVASMGVTRIATHFTSEARRPSPLVSFAACAVGGLSVTLLPAGGLRLLNLPGALLTLYLALGLVVGVIDIVVRISERSTAN